jgi:hypothetical protein
MVANPLNLNTVCAPSEDIIAREIEGEIVIVPLVSGIGNADDELYSLNPTGQAIWKKLNGERTLQEVCVALADEFAAPRAELESDVLGFATELTERKILTARDKG